ncbi:MAG: dephospho-CoA kinase [Clostridiales Family XIII bacterium]|jgi:dephospho-CoA kinase|nr:dephospho-CoA kinase [Clostridiales Family XIII bacterium]
MKIIGLTGGIGSGKTAASIYIAQKGYPVVDADEISREITAKGAEALNAVAEMFGKDLLLPDGGLDRKGLAAIVFSDEGKRRQLNALLHGRIGAKINETLAHLRETGAKTVFVSAPLLLETGMQDGLDAVWLLDAPETLRLDRVRQRDGATAEEIQRRMAAQMPEAEKRALADAVIDNSGDPAALYRRIDALLDAL